MSARTSSWAPSMRVASLGSLPRIWSATRRHCVPAAAWSGWANAVAMKADTTRRLLLPAWASAFLWKCTRQRCQVVESTRAVAASMPSCGEANLEAVRGTVFPPNLITGFTPVRPRRTRSREATRSRRSRLRMDRWPCREPRGDHPLPGRRLRSNLPRGGVHADRDGDGDGHDAATLPDLETGGVDPEASHRGATGSSPVASATRLRSASSGKRRRDRRNARKLVMP